VSPGGKSAELDPNSNLYKKKSYQLPCRAEAPLPRLKYLGCDNALPDQGHSRVTDECGTMVEWLLAEETVEADTKPYFSVTCCTTNPYVRSCRLNQRSLKPIRKSHYLKEVVKSLYVVDSNSRDHNVYLLYCVCCCSYFSCRTAG
jgi:hypothetical protein